MTTEKTMTGAEAISDLLARTERIEAQLDRIETQISEMVGFVREAAEQVSSIAEGGIGSLLGGGGLAGLFGRD